MARPIDPKYPVNQRFGGYATRGVAGRYGGSELETLVAMYGDYQPYGHAGADIACPIGTAVYAMLDGEVVYAGWGEDLPGDESWGPAGYFRRWGLYKNFPGIVTVIRHPQFSPARYSVYGHLSSNDEAPVGARVSAGQVIGKSGNTKTRREYVGPHLHVAIIADPVNYSTGNGLIFGCADPLPYFDAVSVNPQSTPAPAPSKEWYEMTLPVDVKRDINEAVWGGPNIPMIFNNELQRDEFPRTTLGAMTDRIVRQQIVPLRQEVASQNAQIASLIGAIAAMSKGEPFDEAKLLAGVEAAAERGAARGSAEAFADGIELTAQVKQ